MTYNVVELAPSLVDMHDHIKLPREQDGLVNGLGLLVAFSIKLVDPLKMPIKGTAVTTPPGL